MSRNRPAGNVPCLLAALLLSLPGAAAHALDGAAAPAASPAQNAAAPPTAAAAPAPQPASAIVEQNVQYLGKPNNIRVSNGKVELILATDYGPRIMRYAFVGSGDKGNVFATIPPTKPSLKSEYGDWFIYGGHRLWHAPESIPRSYEPDNDPVQAVVQGSVVKLIEATEKHTGIQKEMWISLDPQGTHVTVTHRLTNHNPWMVEMACWALSAMTQDGRCIFPQEPYKSHDDEVRPARPVVLWGYTDLTDPRWMLGKSFLTLHQDVNASGPQKIGVLNKQGWGAYSVRDLLFLKRYAYEPGKNYPDNGVNSETYTDPTFLEFETLGPIERVAPEESITYTEDWWLFMNVDIGTGESGIAAAMQPILDETAPRPK